MNMKQMRDTNWVDDEYELVGKDSLSQFRAHDLRHVMNDSIETALYDIVDGNYTYLRKSDRFHLSTRLAGEIDTLRQELFLSVVRDHYVAIYRRRDFRQVLVDTVEECLD